MAFAGPADLQVLTNFFAVGVLQHEDGANQVRPGKRCAATAARAVTRCAAGTEDDLPAIDRGLIEDTKARDAWIFTSAATSSSSLGSGGRLLRRRDDDSEQAQSNDDET